MTDDCPYTVLSPTKIRLGPDAKHWAHEYGMSLEEFARYLLHRHEHEGDHAEVEPVVTPEVEIHNMNVEDGHVEHPHWGMNHSNIHPSEDIVLPNMHAEGR